MTKSLVEKLGLHKEDKILLINPPDAYEAILGIQDQGYIVNYNDVNQKVNFIHLFANNYNQLQTGLTYGLDKADARCMIWVSWPKQSSKIKSNINREHVRSYVLGNSNWVDTKVCSFDDDWSGLKFLRRRK